MFFSRWWVVKKKRRSHLWCPSPRCDTSLFCHHLSSGCHFRAVKKSGSYSGLADSKFNFARARARVCGCECMYDGVMASPLLWYISVGFLSFNRYYEI